MASTCDMSPPVVCGVPPVEERWRKSGSKDAETDSDGTGEETTPTTTVSDADSSDISTEDTFPEVPDENEPVALPSRSVPDQGPVRGFFAGHGADHSEDVSAGGLEGTGERQHSGTGEELSEGVGEEDPAECSSSSSRWVPPMARNPRSATDGGGHEEVWNACEHYADCSTHEQACEKYEHFTEKFSHLRQYLVKPLPSSAPQLGPGLYHDDVVGSQSPEGSQAAEDSGCVTIGVEVVQDEAEVAIGSRSWEEPSDVHEGDKYSDDGEVSRRGETGCKSPPRKDTAVEEVQKPVSASEGSQQQTSAGEARFSVEDTLFIFDYDDTILPSSFVQGQGLRLDDSSHVNAWQRERLAEVAAVSSKTLELAKRHGTVVLVTNAERGWIELSCQKFLPTLAPMLENLRIVSARTSYEGAVCPSPVDWKVKAFEVELARFYGEEALWDASRDKNIFSLGDGVHEREALSRTTAGLPACCPKSLKFVERPDTHQIVKQHTLVTNCFHRLLHHEGNLDLSIKCT